MKRHFDIASIKFGNSLDVETWKGEGAEEIKLRFLILTMRGVWAQLPNGGKKNRRKRIRCGEFINYILDT